MENKKNAVMVADTRPALVGHILLQLEDTNKGLFEEALVYYIDMTPDEMKALNSIMPCRFIKYAHPLPDSLFENVYFKRFSVMMFARYEMFSHLKEYETITWLDTDILIQDNIDGIIKQAKLCGMAIQREDFNNKSSESPDQLLTAFTQRLPQYKMDSYLYCSGIISVSDKLALKADYTKWCYQKTVEWADILKQPDQGIINLLIQEFDIAVSILNGTEYGAFPLYQRNTDSSKIVHAWGKNKFWNDWYLNLKYPAWNGYYKKWLEIGEDIFPNGILPKISVLMPVYRPNMDWLKQAIDSLVYQTNDDWERYSDFEIIFIAEPFGIENIKQLIETYNDPRLILVVNDERLGISASLNCGLRLAKGEYIARLDSDDIAGKSRLFKQSAYLRSHPGIQMCVTDYLYFGDMNEHRKTFEGEMSRAWSIFTCPFDHPTIMFRKDFFINNKLAYDEEKGHTEDFDLWLRAFDKGMAVGCIHEELTYHRWHSNNEGMNVETGKIMCHLLSENFRKLGIEIPEDLLPKIGPWSGIVDKETYNRIENIFEGTLKQNAMLGVYNQACLKKVFDIRLTEAKTGRADEISSPGDPKFAPNVAQSHIPKRSSLIRRIFKKILRPLYAPFRNRYEDRLARIENNTWITFLKLEELQKTNERLATDLECVCSYIQNLQQKNHIDRITRNDAQSDEY